MGVCPWYQDYKKQPCLFQFPLSPSRLFSFGWWYPCLEQPIPNVTLFGRPVHGMMEESFNTAHGRARNITERAFGLMKARWQATLFKALEIRPHFVSEVSLACAFLFLIIFACHMEMWWRMMKSMQKILAPVLQLTMHREQWGKPQEAAEHSDFSTPTTSSCSNWSQLYNGLIFFQLHKTFSSLFSRCWHANVSSPSPPPWHPAPSASSPVFSIFF